MTENKINPALSLDGFARRGANAARSTLKKVSIRYSGIIVSDNGHNVRATPGTKTQPNYPHPLLYLRRRRLFSCAKPNPESPALVIFSLLVRDIFPRGISFLYGHLT